MKWFSILDSEPIEKPKGTMVIALWPKSENCLERLYGDVRLAVFYKGKFHIDHWRGVIIEVEYWMPLPEPPKV